MFNQCFLEQTIEEAMERCRVPGLALAILKGDDVIYAQGFGTTGVEDSDQHVTPQTVFRLGSMTKMLTTTTIMRLVEAGKLDLDRTIKDYIPWFCLRSSDDTTSITLRMLLSHTAGFPELSLRRKGQRDLEWLNQEMHQNIGRYPLIAHAGTVFSYSTLGFNLAGCIAQEVTGISFPELVRSLVLEPLEMKRTTFDPTVAMTFPHAQLVDEDQDGTLYVDHDGGDNPANYPGAFAFGTVLDLINFAHIHTNGGCFHDHQLLTKKSLTEIQTKQACLHTDTGIAYGLGMYIEPAYKGIRRLGHEGTLPGAAGKLVIAPDVGIAVVLLYNRENCGGVFYPVCDGIIDDIFDQLLSLSPEPSMQRRLIDTHQSLCPYIGTYSRAFAMSRASIFVEDGHLTLCFDGTKLQLEPHSQDLYIGYPNTQEDLSCYPRIPYKASRNVSVAFLHTKEQEAQYISINTNIYKRVEER